MLEVVRTVDERDKANGAVTPWARERTFALLERVREGHSQLNAGLSLTHPHGVQLHPDGHSSRGVHTYGASLKEASEGALASAMGIGAQSHPMSNE